MTESCVAIIPARGGSKRIPDKNIRPFLGKPIISYSIECALSSGLFQRVIVSTDSERIAAIAREHGAEVPFLRSAENSSDHATLATGLIEILQGLDAAGQSYDSFCCLLATAPLVRAKMLLEAHDLLVSGKYDSIVSVHKHDHPILRSLRYSEAGYLEMIWKEHLRTRSQDLEASWHDAGQFYWVTTRAFLDQETIYTKRAGGYPLGHMEAHDIDTLEDWSLVEKLYRFQCLEEGEQ